MIDPRSLSARLGERMKFYFLSSSPPPYLPHLFFYNFLFFFPAFCAFYYYICLFNTLILFLLLVIRVLVHHVIFGNVWSNIVFYFVEIYFFERNSKFHGRGTRSSRKVLRLPPESCVRGGFDCKM